jgi:uncharacterized OB-fold protein
MTPDFVGARNFDLDEWNEMRSTNFERRASDEDGGPSPGAGTQRRCVDCGQVIPAGSKFCPSCGREQ